MSGSLASSNNDYVRKCAHAPTAELVLVCVCSVFHISSSDILFSFGILLKAARKTVLRFFIFYVCSLLLSLVDYYYSLYAKWILQIIQNTHNSTITTVLQFKQVIHTTEKGLGRLFHTPHRTPPLSRVAPIGICVIQFNLSVGQTKHNLTIVFPSRSYDFCAELIPAIWYWIIHLRGK